MIDEATILKKLFRVALIGGFGGAAVMAFASFVLGIPDAVVIPSAFGAIFVIGPIFAWFGARLFKQLEDQQRAEEWEREERDDAPGARSVPSGAPRGRAAVSAR